MQHLKLTVLMSVLIAGSLLQADMEEAKELFDEAKCMECHNNQDFQHREKKVNSYKKLSNSVKACALNSDAEWFDEDADSVTNYLNYKHYHYKVPVKEEED